MAERNINFQEGDPLRATSSPSEGRQTGGEINRDGRRAAQDLSDKGVGVAQRTNKSRRGMKKGPTKVKTIETGRDAFSQDQSDMGLPQRSAKVSLMISSKAERAD